MEDHNRSQAPERSDRTEGQAPPPQKQSSTPPLGSKHMVFDVANWHPKPVKRPRPVKSCTECRRRKLRCDRRCPCSQCQRSYRVCKYGSGGNGSAGSPSKSADPNNPNADSDGSEDEEDDDDMAPGSADGGERPLKRHLSRPGSGSTPQHAHAMPMTTTTSSNHPPPNNSSLNLLLNPSSPTQHHTNLPTPGHGHYHQHQHHHYQQQQQQPQGSYQPSSQPSVPASMQSSFPSLAQISSTLENPEPLMSYQGDNLRKLAASYVLQFMMRMERLENVAKATDPYALSDLPAVPSSSLLSQLHLRQQPSRDQQQRVIEASSTTMRSLSVKGRNGLRTRYFGQNSTRVLLNLFDEAKDFMSDQAKRDTTGDLFLRLERIHTALQENHQQTMKPITVYVDSIMPVQKRMADILPRRDVCDRLISAYVNVSEGLYRVIHVPTFRQEFEAYCAHGVTGGSPGGQGVAEDFLPRLLCIMCIGGRFETDSKGLAYDRSDGVHIPTACALVRSWLDGLRGKPSVDMMTLQTEVLLLHASRMISPRSQRIWTELGMISRLAMAMGLHRDPSEFTPDITPFQAECRRKLWFTILDMDLHVSLASSLPSALRPGEFTCRPPRNLDDADLFPEMPSLPQGKPMDQYTEGQMQLFAADTLPLRMRASDLLCNIDSLTDYWDVLGVGGDLEKVLDDINCLFPRNAALNNHQKHKEWRMRAMLDMHVRRPLLALYRPFALSASAECPPPAVISDVYLKSSMAMLTYMEELDPTIPGFDDVSHMYYVILRNDIVQAAFSVCYYIMQAVAAEKSPGPSGPPGGNGASSGTTRAADGSSPPMGHGPPGGGRNSSTVLNGSGAPRKTSLIWTSTYMIRTVERTVENLARLVNDLSFDLRDVIALATVLGSVMPAANQAQRSDHIRTQVGRVLDTCVEKLRNHSSVAIRSAVLGQSLPPIAHHTPGYDGRQLLPNGKPAQADESAHWDTSFWDIWTPKSA
ncbi:hypothetical protein Sste5346_004627 [Sporothrix stenoceras]|uniref:Zn(2)-C6 fungal-type domain-containing protein n=1 Tax=Sporothrix stenoceras TaxID=5173 RepID=A0ABR3Z9T2_9PEZI